MKQSAESANATARLKIGVVGATGMVGQSFMQTLQDKKFPVAELRPFASEASLGKNIELFGKKYPCQVLKDGCFDGLDLVFFSSGDSISKEWAPRAEAVGAWAVDNSAAFRMDDRYPLMVPEVNADLLATYKKPTIIANPNCSTIQLVVALNPLYKEFGIEAVRVASYQAVSGAGQPGVDDLQGQIEAHAAKKPLPVKNFKHEILSNCIPEIGSLADNGYFTEEMKVIKETRKIMRAPEIKVSAFCVRVPVMNSHAEAVWVTLKKKIEREDLVKCLERAPGIVVQDDPSKSVYPLQAKASGQDPVYVGRIHQDLDDSKTWLMWVVSDNVRKGAALNGIQIAQKIYQV